MTASRRTQQFAPFLLVLDMADSSHVSLHLWLGRPSVNVCCSFLLLIPSIIQVIVVLYHQLNAPHWFGFDFWNYSLAHLIWTLLQKQDKKQQPSRWRPGAHILLKFEYVDSAPPPLLKKKIVELYAMKILFHAIIVSKKHKWCCNLETDFTPVLEKHM